MNPIADKLAALRNWMQRHTRAVIAYSGGVDSSLVLKIATDELGPTATGVLAVSPSLPASERLEALALAAEMGARVIEIATGETDDPRYQANGANRCYFCKEHVYSALRNLAVSRQGTVLLDGMNAEDTLDLRPGRAAARELGVLSPLHELGFSKEEVRAAARQLGLRNWDKPAAACLASRIPYGTRVTHDLLARVERAEQTLKAMGYHTVRVRHHGDVARIEMPASDLDSVLARRREVLDAVAACGYTYVALDLRGFRSGSANEVLTARHSIHGDE